ncbi:MAG: lasso RiPP family leader peptide-containing protein [Labilithrix sp.]|nr:lasso RiPP family leader peptide-containing protein [Labilithrix sp.]
MDPFRVNVDVIVCIPPTRQETRPPMIPKEATETEALAESVPAERRPYRAPQLRKLGSVRELTLGGTMGITEGGGTLRITGKM